MTSRRHNPFALIPDAFLVWFGISAVIAWTLVPAVLEAMARAPQ